LVVSEELDELFEISDRLIVIAKGRVSPSVPTAQASIEQIGEWMSGLWQAAPASDQPQPQAQEQAQNPAQAHAQNHAERA
jgi:general nucleoside transport system ATP-binding protein